MRLTGKYIILAGLFMIIFASATSADLPKEQIELLFEQANDYFRQGNSATDADQAQKYYQQAILSFERIIDEGRIKNAKLYYNLANAHFLKGQIGKAILNYRRAAELGNDSDIQKNLAFARSQRKDQVTAKVEKRVLHTLFFWHYDFSAKTKLLMLSLFFAVVCCSGTAMIWWKPGGSLIATAIVCGILAVCFLSSIIIEVRADANNIGGVITTGEVVAYQGDSESYPPSFKEPLHEGTEFNLLEKRSGWLHIRLFDDSSGWIPDDSAELI